MMSLSIAVLITQPNILVVKLMKGMNNETSEKQSNRTDLYNSFSIRMHNPQIGELLASR